MREAPTIDLGRLAPDLGSTCDGYLTDYRRDFARAIERGDEGVAAARRFARVLDGLLGALYCAADAAARQIPSGRIALVAVGGYGRGIVGLHSDVDVLFLCDDPSDARVKMLAEGLLYPLWDLGVDIGHAVRGVSETLELAREDIRTATTLLDLRRVAGDREIVRDLEKGARRQVFEPHLDSFLNALEDDTAHRHERYGDSLYLLEPGVKNGRGGLRDLDVAEWAAHARWDARKTEDLVRTGALLRREVDELRAAREMLWRVRNLLHLRAGRQQDRLTFADQEEVALQLGFVDGITLGVEQFMQAYYRHAQVVAQTAERMLDRARPSRRRVKAEAHELGDGTARFDDKVTLVRTDALDRDPALAFRLYHNVMKQGLEPYSFARDAVARVAVDPEWTERLRASPEATRLFTTLLTSTATAPLARGTLLSELHEVGLTVAMVPELEPLVGRVRHDVYHVYTVDVHTVRSVDRLRSLFAGQHREFRLATRLAAEAPRRMPLFVATLLHALGKVHGGDRPERGATMARPIAERLGLSPVDVEHVVWLIQEQRSFYHWATRRDTSDPETLGEIASRVGTSERLRDLYLLTVSILSTTNPTAMSAWKARMLEDLYFGLTAVLTSSSHPADASGFTATARGRAGELREEVSVGFVGDADQDSLERFVVEMPDRYILSNPVDAIRRHARAARDAQRTDLSLTLGPGPSEEVSELVLQTKDRAGLLADVAAVLSAHHVEVRSAQIYTRGPEAFDVFWVRRAGFERSGPPPLLDRPLRERLERDLRRRLAGELTADELLARSASTPRWARRRSPEVPTEVVVDNTASPTFTVVDVFTRDRPGVLHTIAQTLHERGVTIALSKINTEGERVADVFYVVDPAHGKLQDPARLEALREALSERLAALHAREEAS